MLATREERFVRYSVVGGATFALDLALLWLLIEGVKMQYLYATALAFLLAVSLNYVLSRAWVFPGSKRTVGHGYLYFLKFAILGMALTTALMWLLTSYTSLHFAVVRICIAGVVGIGTYMANLHINFKVVGRELRGHTDI